MRCLYLVRHERSYTASRPVNSKVGIGRRWTRSSAILSMNRMMTVYDGAEYKMTDAVVTFQIAGKYERAGGLNMKQRCMRTATRISRRKVSATDRNGRHYGTDEMKAIYGRLYHLNPKALLLMFPEIDENAINKRATYYGLKRRASDAWTNEELAHLHRLFPDRIEIQKVTGRTIRAVESKCLKLGLKVFEPGSSYTQEQDKLLKLGQSIEGKTDNSMRRRRERLGIKLSAIKSLRSIDPQDLLARIDSLISKGYPADKRQDMIQHVFQECLEGRCVANPAALKACAKKAVTAVYRLHPDRGAPLSLDAKLFDDGGTTVGDRIASDTFHF